MFCILTALCLCTTPPVDNTIAEYRDFALTMPGDASRGQDLFARESVGCTTCHTVGTAQRKAGPDLLGVGDKFERAELIQAVLEPSVNILTGYATTTFVTRSGVVRTGILERRDPRRVEILVATGERVSIPSAEIAEETQNPTSLMPAELYKVMTREDFADLIAYLAILKQSRVDSESFEGLPQEIPAVARPIRLEPLHREEFRFARPVGIHVVPGTIDRFLIVQHNPAELWILEKGLHGDRKWLFLDLSAEARAGSDTGIVGMVFHPDFVHNGTYYVYHHAEGLSSGAGPMSVVLVERRASDDRRRDSGAPSRHLLRVGRFTVAHTGGAMEFGSDGFLYLGIGDGGPQEDPEGNAQNLHLFLGSILRLDVDHRSPGLAYAIPPSNPLVGHPDPLVRQEIWAWGFRQPWRFSFDKVTDDLWVGDVGQVNFEEVSIVRRGENHGWNVYETYAKFSDKYRQKGVEYVPPVLSLARKHGVSVTGGYVYRGTRSPSYQGVYVFGDYESKRLWGMTQQDRKLVTIREIGRAPDRIVAFAQDPAGELYLVGYDKGQIYRLLLEDSIFEPSVRSASLNSPR